ncbi:unnamed protein product [Closterium sp. NIES-65]|nr:unnamed protein product [Closterium sp. NIES-65]
MAANGSGLQYPKSNAKSLNALRQEAFRTAEELTFNMSVDMTRPKHGSDADGNEAVWRQESREFKSLAALPAAKLAEEIMRLDHKLASHAEQIARPKKRPVSRESGVAVVSYEDLAAAVERAQRQMENAALVLEEESKALALERVALRDQRNQEALVLSRVDARLGQLQGVMVDSMEGAQKKLTDEVSRKIDNMSSAVSATTERAITTSGVTNALHTIISLVVGSPPPRMDVEEQHATEGAEPGDTEHGKRAAGAKAENQRGPMRQRGPQAAPVVRHQKWGTASRGAGQSAPPGSSSRSVPAGELAPKPPLHAQANAMPTATACKGKGKAEVEEPATTGKRVVKLEVLPATAAASQDAKRPAIAPAQTGQHGHSASASAGPSAAVVEQKSKKRGRGAKMPPPPPVYTIDEDGEEELENLCNLWVGPTGDGGEQGGEGGQAAVEVDSDGESADEEDGHTLVVTVGETGGQGDTGPKRRGCGIRPPPRGGPGLISELHLGGKKRWLGHGERKDLQYKTAVAMMPYDLKVDPGLNLTPKQLRTWAADLFAAMELHTGLLITMHYRDRQQNPKYIATAILMHSCHTVELVEHNRDVVSLRYPVGDEVHDSLDTIYRVLAAFFLSNELGQSRTLPPFALPPFPLPLVPLPAFPLPPFPLTPVPLPVFPLPAFPLAPVPLSMFPLAPAPLPASPLAPVPFSAFPLAHARLPAFTYG